MANTTRTFLRLPDGAEIEFLPNAGIREFRVTYDQFPRFVIDGQRYRVDTANEFPYLPGFDGRVWYYDLVPLKPTTN